MLWIVALRIGVLHVEVLQIRLLWIVVLQIKLLQVVVLKIRVLQIQLLGLKPGLAPLGTPVLDPLSSSGSTLRIEMQASKSDIKMAREY